MLKVCRDFTIFSFLMIVAILPTHAAEEEGNANQPSWKERVDSVLKSGIDQNPDLQSCKITVTIGFRRDSDSITWTSSIDSISISTENPSDNQGEDSAGEGDVSDSSASNNIISWFLGGALLVALLMLFLPTLKKHLQYVLNFVDNTDGRRNSSTGYHGDNNKQQNSQHDIRGDSDCSQKRGITTEKTWTNIQTEKAMSVDVVDTTERIGEQKEEKKTVLLDRQTEPETSLKSIVKYGQLAVLSQDKLVTESDYMTDNAANAPFEFTFSPGMEVGTYDIARNSLQSFLSDISMIRPYVQEIDVIPNAQKIVTISKGKLRKKGLQWVVTEKLKIKLQ